MPERDFHGELAALGAATFNGQPTGTALTEVPVDLAQRLKYHLTELEALVARGHGDDADLEQVWHIEEQLAELLDTDDDFDGEI